MEEQEGFLFENMNNVNDLLVDLRDTKKRRTGSVENDGNDGNDGNDAMDFDSSNSAKQTYINLIVKLDQDSDPAAKVEFDVTWQTVKDLELGCEKLQNQFNEIYQRFWNARLDQWVQKLRRVQEIANEMLLQQVQNATRSLPGGEDYIQEKYLEPGDKKDPQNWMQWHADFVEQLGVQDPMENFLSNIQIPEELRTLLNEITPQDESLGGDYDFEDMADLWDSAQLEFVYSFFLNQDNIDFLNENAQSLLMYPDNVELFSPTQDIALENAEMSNGYPPGIINVGNLIENAPSLHRDSVPWTIEMEFYNDVPYLGLQHAEVQDYYVWVRIQGIKSFFQHTNLPKRFITSIYSRILNKTREQEMMQLVMRKKEMPYDVEYELVQYGNGIHSRLPSVFLRKK